MAKESGINVVIQVGQSDGSPETFTTLEGQQEGSLSFNPVTADITDKSNAGWGGTINVLNNATVNVSGVYDTTATQLLTMMDELQNRTARNYRFVFNAGGDYFEGRFYVTGGPELSGGVTTATTYSFTLSNDGEVVRGDV